MRCKVTKRGKDIEALIKGKGIVQVNKPSKKTYRESLSFSSQDCCAIRKILIGLPSKHSGIFPVGYLSFNPTRKIAAQKLHILVVSKDESEYLDKVEVLADALGGTLSRVCTGKGTFGEALFYTGDKCIVLIPCPPEAFGANWVYFSLPTYGSRITLSLYANALGYKLRRNGLWFNGNLLSTPDADTFLRYLGLPRNFVEHSFDRLKDALYPLSCKLAEAAQMAAARKKGIGRKREIETDNSSTEYSNDPNKWWLTSKAKNAGKDNFRADSIKTENALKKIRRKGIRLNYLRVQETDPQEIR